MWVTPEDSLFKGSSFWSLERTNPYFTLQRRKGRAGGGLSGMLVGTMDAVLDTRPPAFRILHHTDGSEVYAVVAECATAEEAAADWRWLERHILPDLLSLDAADDVTEYVKVKIASLAARDVSSGAEATGPDDAESLPYKHASEKFRLLFKVGAEDKLVSYYSCTYWQGAFPAQGWTYLTVNHLAFYSLILGKETKLLLRWTDVTDVEVYSRLLFPAGVRVATREAEHHFSFPLSSSRDDPLTLIKVNLVGDQTQHNRRRWARYDLYYEILDRILTILNPSMEFPLGEAPH